MSKGCREHAKDCPSAHYELAQKHECCTCRPAAPDDLMRCDCCGAAYAAGKAAGRREVIEIVTETTRFRSCSCAREVRAALEASDA